VLNRTLPEPRWLERQEDNRSDAQTPHVSESGLDKRIRSTRYVLADALKRGELAVTPAGSRITGGAAATGVHHKYVTRPIFVRLPDSPLVSQISVVGTALEMNVLPKPHSQRLTLQSINKLRKDVIPIVSWEQRVV
jgi:hypothetical protein